MGDGRSDGIVIDYYRGDYVVRWKDIGIRSHSPIDFEDIIKAAKYKVITPSLLDEELFIV